MVIRLAGSRDDAEDIMQETFLKAIDNIDQFRGESSFGTWLYAIALNQTRMLFSKQKQAELKPIEEYLPGTDHGDGHTSGDYRLFDWQDPHAKMESAELRKAIDSSVRELPYKYREAFILRYVEELPVKEVARLTGESEAATKSRILRARLALRDKLSSIFEAKYGQEMSGLH
jgi:RNA polymerase sigma-70 factor (ECF subfamily)